MAQPIKGACHEAWRPDFIPGTHMVEAEDQLFKVVL